MELHEIAQELSSPNARIEGGGRYENKRGVVGYRTRIRSGARWFMLSLPSTANEVKLCDIAAALSSPSAVVVSDGAYENRAGANGYYASVLAGGQWYLISISEAEEIPFGGQSLANDSSSAIQNEEVCALDAEVPVGNDDFVGVLGQTVEFLSSENMRDAVDLLVDRATNGFGLPTKDAAEDFFLSLLEELDAAATDLRKDPDELEDEILTIEEYFPQDEGVEAAVRDDYRLRGLMHQVFQREPLEPLPTRLSGLRFAQGIKELKALLTESRHFIVKIRGILRVVY
jgi:hypothetical protein